jgi:hypothetical protein
METDRPPFHILYCRTRGIAPSAFARELLRHSVYPQARPWLGLLTWLNPGHFDPDYEFIADVSGLRRRTDFGDAAESYLSHPHNRGFLRRQLRLRISVRRMLRLVNEVLPQNLPWDLRDRLEAKDSLTPFETGEIQNRKEAEPETD